MYLQSGGFVPSLQKVGVRTPRPLKLRLWLCHLNTSSHSCVETPLRCSSVICHRALTISTVQHWLSLTTVVQRNVLRTLLNTIRHLYNRSNALIAVFMHSRLSILILSRIFTSHEFSVLVPDRQCSYTICNIRYANRFFLGMCVLFCLSVCHL